MLFVIKAKNRSPQRKRTSYHQRRGSIRCKVLTRDGYLNWIFIIKSSKGYVQLSYSRLKTSLISHFFSLLVSKITKRLAGKKKTKNADYSSIGQFYQHGLFFSQRFHTVHVTLQLISKNFEIKSYSRCWLTLFGRFQNHRNLNSDLYPRKSTGSNEKDFRAYLKPNFSNTFYEHSEQHNFTSFIFLLCFFTFVLFCFVFFFNLVG